jgi:hypothetical protein
MKIRLLAAVMIVFVISLVSVIAVLAVTSNALYFAHNGNYSATGGTISEAIATPDDGKFIQLAPNSWVTLKFPGNYAAAPDGTSAADLRIDTFDTLYQADAKIYVSLNGSVWTYVGTFADTANIDLDLLAVDGPVKYVKVDQGTEYIAPPYLDLGFDLDSVVALNARLLPYGEITKPAANATVSGSVLFEAIYWDDDPAGVQWAIRPGLCTSGLAAVWSNVDGRNDPFTWNGHIFQTTADTTQWAEGLYCFVFNPTEGGGEADIRLTQFNVVDNNQPPVVDAGGPYSGDVGEGFNISGTATDPNNDALTYLWSVNSPNCVFGDSEALSTTLTCQLIGNYTLTLAVSDGAHNVTDTASLDITDPDLTTSLENCTHETYTRYNYLETKFVSSVGLGADTPVVSSTTLNPAVQYLIEASGVYYAGGVATYDIRADARYTNDLYQRNHGDTVWTDLLHGYETFEEVLLDLKVDGDRVEWGDYTNTHRYTIVKPGTGSNVKFQFQIDEVYGQNNVGGLCVSLYEFENDAPTANPGGPYLGAVNAAISFDGTGSSDPDGDGLTYAWTFGDGGTGTGGTPTHSYADAGIYNVCLKVNDGYVDSTEVCTLAVVYDPSAGFVTGGGWIDSPAGAYAADPTLTGKATFGFVAKYQKGANLPSGNTEFQFKVGNLNFKSTSYEWLVVAGTQAIFKGAGSINGQGTYTFMITVNDDTPDTFRIKIWDSASDTLIYDIGSQQEIGGGSIVIHK